MAHVSTSIKNLNFPGDGWNANTNVPKLISSVGIAPGYAMYVTTAGSTNIDGTSSWAQGDVIYFTGLKWTKIPIGSNSKLGFVD